MAATVYAKLMEECKRLIRSGAVDLENEQDDYRIPKALIHVALKNVADGWSPLHWDKATQKLIKSLSHF